MAVKKVKLPNNTTLDINDARVVSDGITYIGEDIDSATYEAPSTGSVVTWGTESSNHTVPLIVDGVSKTVALNGYSSGGGGGGTGEENVIEIVKVNGTALTPDANKAVDVSVPTDSTVSGWGYIKTYTETDPTVPSWAKASTKPSYTASEVGALPDTTSIPTESTVAGWGFTKNAGTVTGVKVNGTTKTPTSGTVDIGTVLTSYTETDPVYSASAAAGITSSDITNWNGKTSNVGTITGITMNGSSKGTSGVVNLGTVVTSETDPVFTASAAHGISSTDISNWNAKQKAITVSSSEPTSSQGSNGDIWIVI